MAMFNFQLDLAERQRKQEEERKLKEARQRLIAAHALEGINPTEEELATFEIGNQVDPLRGVTGNDPHADLQAQLRNEELNRAPTDNRESVESVRRMLAMVDAGMNPKQIAEAREIEMRRAMLEEVLAERGFTPEQIANAANRLDVSPGRADSGRLYNRFDPEAGYTTISPDVMALETKRLDEAGAARALTGERMARTRDIDMRTDALQDVLADESLSPTMAADVVNKRTVNKPQRVKVRRADGREEYFDATPNLSGGFDYSPVTDASGERILSEGSTSDSDTALQKDTRFIAETLDVSPNEAILMKLQSRSKAPRDAWSDLVARMISSNRIYARDPDRLQADAEKIWHVLRPGEPVPLTAPAGSGGQQQDKAALLQEARTAIERGADAEAVKARLRELGVDTDEL